jgi:hypothetical protein
VEKKECEWSHLGARIFGPPTLKTQGYPPTRLLPLCVSKNAYNHNARILTRRNLYLFHFVVAFISYLPNSVAALQLRHDVTWADAT